MADEEQEDVSIVQEESIPRRLWLWLRVDAGPEHRQYDGQQRRTYTAAACTGARRPQ